MSTSRRLWLDWTVDRSLRGLIWMAQRLPYARRVALMGRLLRMLGGVTGYRARADAQLAWIFPEMSKAERRRITGAVLDNFGRTAIENYSGADQLARARRWEPHGPGLAACEAARMAGRPILFVSGHFGNHQAIRAAMNLRGYAIGGLWRPFNNRYSNAHYIASIEAVGGRAFARDRRGLAEFVKNLREGGHGAILLDQHVSTGAMLDFLGQAASTSLSAAEMALKYDALLVPIYGERLQDGIDFDIRIEAPIPPSDPVTMTQAINDSLSARVRARPEQWLWIHRRWKAAGGTKS
ncbi:lysophospholipid acyltransferase family protein [uncultured Roseicyclus sp.]|jgi:Kdo2-lipid IVA lauroyltransferase/acyltransferase|uniref:lysophospholipid acyltransferase family protein n=1 Tax=uncultured Roseicyclus sp. TaxID=543072 RepID=UPI002628D588|nr:lysophospholipid acyltransferase family protein [uncultured Roseicyclus sp.]